MSEVETKNARITSTTLGYEDHGILTCMLMLDYGDCGAQGFGGYGLDSYVKDRETRVGTEYGMQFIIEILNTVGVEKWEDLVGKHIRVKADWGKVHAIGNVLSDKWFNPEEFWEKYKNKEAAA